MILADLATHGASAIISNVTPRVPVTLLPLQAKSSSGEIIEWPSRRSAQSRGVKGWGLGDGSPGVHSAVAQIVVQEL